MLTDLDLISFSNKDISNHALDGKNLPNRIKILNWGKNETTQGDVYLNDKTLAVFDAMQEKTGRDEDVALDFDHCTVPGSKEYVAGQPKNIAAYGDPELIKDDGLYLKNLQWTPLGKEKARNYKDLSPACAVSNDGTVTGLHSAALTPNGSVKGLKFYSANGFDDMIKKMSSSDQGASSAKETAIGFDDDFGGMDMMSAEDVTSAWSKMCDPKNLIKYDSNKISIIKNNIKTAAKKFGVNLDDNGDKQKQAMNVSKTKTMSAESNSFPDAYKSQPWQYNTMNDSIIKMAAEVGMEGETDADKVLFAFLAKYVGLKAEYSQQITRKDNTEDGGLKQFSAKFEILENQIKALKEEKEQENLRVSQFERKMLIDQATKEGVLIPMSADNLASVDINVLKDLVSNLKKNTVPLKTTMRTLSVDSNKKPSKAVAVSAFADMVASQS